MIMVKKIEYRDVVFWKGSNGMLFGKVRNPNIQRRLTVETAKRCIDSIMQLSSGAPMALCMDLRDTKGTFSIEAAHFLADAFDQMPQIVYEAYVVNSLSINLLVQSFKRIYSTKAPYGIFQEMSGAEKECLFFINSTEK